MTRDEAIEIDFRNARKVSGWNTLSDDSLRGICANAVDGYVALGMLRLDEPKNDFNPYEHARVIFRNRFGDQIAGDLLAALHASGLGIIDRRAGNKGL